MEDYTASIARNKVYKALSICFHYPNEDLFGYLKGEFLHELQDSLSKTSFRAGIEKRYTQLESALTGELLSVSLDDLQVAHTGLFIYARGAACCFPYESFYREKNKCLMGDSTIAAKRFYQMFKLRVSRKFRDLPDHISVELEFMHFLTHNEAAFSVRGDNRGSDLCIGHEIRFLENHLLKWVSQFTNCVIENSDSKFFVTLSQLIRDFLKEDATYLACQKETVKKQSPGVDMAGMQFDTSTLTVLEASEVPPDPKVRWVYTTSPERYWYSPVKVKVVDGRAVQIIARDDIPYFDGKQDLRAFACFAKLYAADKLKFPLKRVGRRGEGKFKRISWDEALSEIAAVLKKYRDQGNAKYVGFLRTHPPLEFMFNHFTHHYGSPNDVHASATSCYADGKVADVLTGGSRGCLGTDDYLNSRYSLYIGHNLLCGIHGTPRAARFAEAIRRGMKFVFVDPRLNEGSYTHGAEWVPIKPGTDAAFILGLMNVIIREKMYDEGFLLRHTNAPILVSADKYAVKNRDGAYLVWDTAAGKIRPLAEAEKPALLGSYEVKLGKEREICKTAFQELTERAEMYAPEEVARITTIHKNKIKQIARDLGTMKPNVCIFSQDNVSAQYTNSLQRCRARNALMCLLGVFDRPGGKYYGPYGSSGIHLNKGKDFRIPIDVHPMSDERVDFDSTVHSCINAEPEENHYPNGIIQNFLKAIKTGKPYPIKALFIIGCDMLASHSSEWRDAFEEMEFIVKSHVWPDDDVDYADIVLPEAVYLERDDGFAQVAVHDPKNKDREFSFLTAIQQVVEPQFEERPWLDYVQELARRIGFGEYFDFALDEYWNFLLEPAGIDIDYLRENGVYYPTPVVTRQIEFGKKERWNTDTGRLNIYSSEMVDLWHKSEQRPLFDPVPVYCPLTKEPKGENEFYLISGKVSYFKCNFYRDNPMLLERYLEGELGNTLVWINAKKAAALRIKNGDSVWVESQATGLREKVRVKVTEGIHPSAVWHVYGFGHRSKLMDNASRAREGINVQNFVPEHYVPFTGGQAHCEAIVKVYKNQE